MALTSIDDKLAVMEWDNLWEPALPIAESAPFAQGDKQQLLWGLPDPLWGVIAAVDADPQIFGVWERVPLVVGIRARDFAETHERATAHVEASVRVLAGIVAPYAIVTARVQTAVIMGPIRDVSMVGSPSLAAALVVENDDYEALILLTREFPG